MEACFYTARETQDSSLLAASIDVLVLPGKLSFFLALQRRRFSPDHLVGLCCYINEGILKINKRKSTLQEYNDLKLFLFLLFTCNLGSHVVRNL